MSSPLKRRFVFLIVTVAVVASAAGAYAASQTSPANSRQAFLNDVARRLHVTPTELRNALQGAFADRLSAAVRAGRLTKAQASAIEKRLKASGAAPFWPGPPVFAPGLQARVCAFRVTPRGVMPAAPPGWGRMPPGWGRMPPGRAVAPGLARKLGQTRAACGFGIVPRGGLAPAPSGAFPPGAMVPVPKGAGPRGRLLPPPGAGLPPGILVPAPRRAHPPAAVFVPGFFGFGLGPGFMLGGTAARSYLHITPAKLMADRRAGMSLAQIATAQHRTARGLESVVEAAIGARLNKAVAAGAIPRAVARRMLAVISARVAAIVHARPGHWAPQWLVPAPHRPGSRHGAAFSQAGPPQSSD